MTLQSIQCYVICDQNDHDQLCRNCSINHLDHVSSSKPCKPSYLTSPQTASYLGTHMVPCQPVIWIMHNKGCGKYAFYLIITVILSVITVMWSSLCTKLEGSDAYMVPSLHQGSHFMWDNATAIQGETQILSEAEEGRSSNHLLDRICRWRLGGGEPIGFNWSRDQSLDGWAGWWHSWCGTKSCCEEWLQVGECMWFFEWIGLMVVLGVWTGLAW